MHNETLRSLCNRWRYLALMGLAFIVIFLLTGHTLFIELDDDASAERLYCPADSAVPLLYCGDGVCDADETAESCPDDCIQPPNPCGNGFCDTGEDRNTCPLDCAEGAAQCGNGTCEAGETSSTCSADCPDQPEENASSTLIPESKDNDPALRLPAGCASGGGMIVLLGLGWLAWVDRRMEQEAT